MVYRLRWFLGHRLYGGLGAGTKVVEKEPSQSSAQLDKPAKPIPIAKENTDTPVTSSSPQDMNATPAGPQMPMYNPYSLPQMVSPYSMPPPIPPSSYNPYSTYVAYPTPNWPVYGQVHQPPPPSHMVVLPPAPVMPVMRSNLRVIETKDVSDVKPPAKTEAAPSSSVPEAASPTKRKPETDRRNKESEKTKSPSRVLKVLEEMDSIKEAQTARRESLKALVAKVEQLRLQQGILLRKKQREKYAHKDPLLEELTSILDNARLQIKALRQEITDATKKQQQLTKVAEILGIRPCELVDKTAKSEGKDPSPPNTASSKGSDTILKSSQDAKQSELKSGSDTKAKDSISSSDPRSKHCFSSSTSTEKSEESSTQTRGPSPKSSSDNTRPEPKKTSEESKSKSPPPSQLPSSHTAKHSFNLSELFEYYDAGSHWCEQCSVVCRTLEGFLLHLHEKNHLEVRI
ncbi:hypothetical protein GDO86_020024 [Hymenochirus boettgeri]|uniref:Zinc finger protein 318 n=1 Tax=Hymenochirus boettgeri TaxID=247094 RepID=A0A8T2II06_9PIPI|nr:hypothetical protein GDO86_020024 [Hymenochirus boettgeri]